MKKYYFVGIKGSGMSSLAQLLHDFGNTVIGYDDNKHHSYTEDELKKRGIKIFYETPSLDKDYIVIKTSAVRDEHEEIKNAKELGLEVIEYFEMLGKITEQYKTIAISGTHGKTSTTAMLTNVLSNTTGVSYIIGDGTGKGTKDTEHFVIEACEFKRHFLNYFPTYTIITNIELEHVEYYKDIEDVISAFQEFVDKTKDTIIACGDDLNVRKLKSDKIKYYGLNDNNDIVAKNIIMTNKGAHFDVIIDGELFGTFDIPLFGKHMILNSLAVIYTSFLEGVDKQSIRNGLLTFKGAKRRFNETFIDDIVSIDDYAHHPTEISVTIDAARQKYPNKELVAIVKPNTYSRTKELYLDFVKALKKADKVYVTDIFCDRELPSEFPGVTSNLIIDRLENAQHLNESELDNLLAHRNAVMLFMSCKDIYTMKGNYEKKLIEKIHN